MTPLRESSLIKFTRNPKVLREYAEGRFSEQWGVVKNPYCDEECLEVLSREPDSVLRMMVARHKNVSIELLEELSRDRNSDVKTVVALNRRTPERIYQKILEEEAESISNLTQNIAGLIFDPDEDDLFHDDTPDLDVGRVLPLYKSWKFLPKSMMIHLASSQDTSAETLEMIYVSAEKNVFIQRALAGSPNSSPWLMGKLADEESDSVRFEVAKNTEDAELLDRLKKDDSSFVRLGAGLNPTVDEEFRVKLREEKILENFTLGGDAYRYIKESSSPTVINPHFKGVPFRRFADLTGSWRDFSATLTTHLAVLPETPVEVLRAIRDEDEKTLDIFLSHNMGASSEFLNELYLNLRNSETELWRLGLALNPNTPASVLFDMKEGSSSSLRSLIEENPNHDFNEYVDEFIEVSHA